ncbi:type I polyketide synthase [Streptomyces sp. NPDC051576]|uniref:type I polyketide synthase n=1 Tax=Streptomyces sp. NPDC051576 TaxID=3155803 RepID=UPI00341EF3AF
MTQWDPDDDPRIAMVGMAARIGTVTGDGGPGETADPAEEAAGQPWRIAGGLDTRRPLAGYQAFDHRFFGVSPRESALLDPQHRILLECAQHALEDAGQRPSDDDLVIGVYAGGGATGHAAWLRGPAGPSGVDDRQIRAGTGADFLAARVAYKLGLTGPAVSLQAAAATGLVAVHTAVQALLGGECDLALAGAVSVRPAADGPTATGGCVVIVLKPLATAEEQGDRILAVVSGTAVGRSAPNESDGDGRDRIARYAALAADTDPDTVTPVEVAHADGVTDVAPAMAALVQAVLAMYEAEPGGPGRAGVTVSASFGLHAGAVLEPPPAPPQSAGEEAVWQLLPLSAKTPDALADVASDLRDHLLRVAGSGNPTPLREVAWTLQTGRTAHVRRACVVARDTAGAAEELAGLKTGERVVGDSAGGAPPVVFTFPGHGGQHLGMARELYRTDDRFRADVDTAAELVQAETGLDLRPVLDPVGDAAEEAARQALSDGGTAQHAVFVVEHALARALQHRGVRPAAVVGHSLGGYAAACVAGVFSLPDAVRMVVARTRLLLSLAPGAMAAVRMPERELLTLLPAGVGIGAISGPDQVTISGPRTMVEEFVTRAQDKDIEARLLKIPGAGHSSLVDPVLGEFAAFLESVEFRAPDIPVISDTTGTWARPEHIATPDYWCEHMRRTVRYHDVLRTLAAFDDCALVEVGPGTTLTSLARRDSALRRDHLVMPLLPHPTDPTPAPETFLTALGALWTAGVDIDWAALHEGYRPRRTGLPGYPFRRTEFPLPVA